MLCCSFVDSPLVIFFAMLLVSEMSFATMLVVCVIGAFMLAIYCIIELLDNIRENTQPKGENRLVIVDAVASQDEKEVDAATTKAADEEAATKEATKDEEATTDAKELIKEIRELKVLLATRAATTTAADETSSV
jgi:hypothetical protein